MLNILEKHKIIGGKGLNTLTYLENNDEDFNEGELDDVIVEDNTLKNLSIDPTCLAYYPFTENLEDMTRNTTITNDLGTLSIDTNEKALRVVNNRGLLKNLNISNLTQLTVEYMWKPTHSSFGGGLFMWGLEHSLHPLDTNGTKFGFWDGTNRIANIIPTLNEWCHQMYTYNNGENKLYHNGELVLTWTYTKTFSNTDMQIFCHQTSTNYNQGYVKHLKVHSKVLTEPTMDNIPSCQGSGYRISPQITTPRNLVSAKCDWEGEGKISTYQYTKKQGIDENTVLYLKGEDFTDSSLYNKPITNVDATINSNGKVNKGIELAKTRINIDKGMEGVDLSKDFTIDWWEYSTGATTGSGLILNRTVTNSNYYGRCFLIGHNGTLLYAGTSSATTSWNIFNAVKVKDKVDNVWVHWAFVKKGTKYTTYKNGVEFWTTTNSSVFGALEGNKLCLGAWIDYSTVSMGYNAIIDNFRISNIARWETDFIPPEKDYELDEEIITPLEKGKTINSLPNPLQLKQEVEGEETISKVSLEMKYKVEDKYTVPKEEGEDNTFYLYNEGDECTDITGGLVQKYLYNGSLTKNSNHIYMKGNYGSNGGYATLSTTNTIELTRYTKLCALVDVLSISTRGSFRLYVKQSFGNAPWDNNLGDLGTTQIQNNMLLELDVTNFTGNYFVSFGADGGSQGSGSVQVNVHKLWLEK